MKSMFITLGVILLVSLIPATIATRLWFTYVTPWIGVTFITGADFGDTFRTFGGLFFFLLVYLVARYTKLLGDNS
jgi:hypothetical protein